MNYDTKSVKEALDRKAEKAKNSKLVLIGLGLGLLTGVISGSIGFFCGSNSSEITMAITLVVLYAIPLLLAVSIRIIGNKSNIDSRHKEKAAKCSATIHGLLTAVPTIISIIKDNSYEWFITLLFIVGSLILIFAIVNDYAERIASA